MSTTSFTRGKSDFLMVLNEETGEKESMCLCEHNYDFSRGCINRVPHELLEEIVEFDGSYSPERMAQFKREGFPNEGCKYCYARRNNQGSVKPHKIDRREFEKHKPKVVRLEKRSEAGHPFFREALIDFLELCKEFKTKVIFPTKNLDFDERVAKLLVETDSVVHFSLGWDKLEEGACGFGCTNDWRIQQALQYKAYGVNTALTVVCDVTSSIDHDVRYGSSIRKALDTDVVTRVIPLRLNSKKLARELGLEWHVLLRETKGQLTLGGDAPSESRQMSYLQKGSNDLIAKYFHPDFQELVDGGMGVCGRVGDFEYCDRCQLEGDTRLVYHISRILKIEYNKAKKPKETDRRQQTLF